jgi:hypothetical protein
MSSKIAYAGILGLIALCVGCTLPCHPFDNNGPVYDSAGQCVSNERAGSILADGEMQATVEDQGVIEETTPTHVQYGPPSGNPGGNDVEGATQILSVTDRKVESSETMAKSQPDEANQSRLAQPTTLKRR